MPKRIRREPIYIAPDIMGCIQENGNYFVFDERINEELNPLDVFDKIKIYERQVRGWFLEPTLKMIKYNSKNKGFLVLMSCLSYIEGIEQYKRGNNSQSNSQQTFIEGLQRIFPNKFSYQQLKDLYKQARCGLFHDGMTRGQIIISNTYQESILFENNGDIKINQKKFFNDLQNDFNQYIEELKNNEIARNNFNNMFTNI